MPVISVATLADASPAALESCDVCIIGSGPAGSTVARELSGTGLCVTVLESGGTERDKQKDLLNEIESIGRPRVMDQWLVRNRIVGGSSHTWTGRCAAFDAIDFERRDWVPDSGWPIGLDDLDDYLVRSAAYLGLSVGAGFSDDRFWSLARRPIPSTAPDPDKLMPFFWQFSKDLENTHDYMRFGRHLASQIGPNVTLATEATVTAIVPDASGRTVRSVEFVGPDGRRRTLSAVRVVLCAGGIENARLLLTSDSVMSGGLGNDRGTVGRYLMDHPRGGVAAFEIKGSEQLQKRFGLYKVGSHLFRAGLRLSPHIQRAEGLLNCAAWLGESITPDDPWHALKRVLRGKPRLPDDVLAIATNAGLFTRGLKQYFVDRNGLPRKLDALNLDCMCEQRPDPDSRVTLSERRDRFGVRLSRIDWRIHDDEARSVRRTAMLAADEFARMGLPKPVLAAWVRDGEGLPPSFIDIAHPSGTTRMAENPSKGVVDSDLQVHGIEGLFIAGSSVFPTAGHCNPTQMIVATALRLSDHIKATAQVGEHRNGETPMTRPQTSSSMQTRADAGAPLVLITGATGRIGRVAVRHLIEGGYRVRATTSGSQLPADVDDGSLTWRHLDLRRPGGDLSSLVSDCAAVIHLAAAMTEVDDMAAINVDGTRALAAAAERAAVPTFVYVSSVAVYGSASSRVVTEDTAVLTASSDVPSEYWAVDRLRAYGRTKLGGELSIRDVAAATSYVIFRPTVVVDVEDLLAIRDWPKSKRAVAAHRHAHHVYVGDVADALRWAIERGLAGALTPGTVEVFNLEDDECEAPVHAEFMRRAYAACGDAGYSTRPLPSVVDWARDIAKFRSLPLRNPLWRMRFSGDRLRAAGWKPPIGMAKIQSEALRRLASNGKS